MTTVRSPVGHLGHLDRIDAELAAFRRTSALGGEARRAVKTAIAAALADGLTWQQIAEHLGVTRQAAWTRWRLTDTP